MLKIKPSIKCSYLIRFIEELNWRVYTDLKIYYSQNIIHIYTEMS